ncbi:MAG TPA: phosphate/phosphite/phosphonate ABC transporter substrate-binding protein [Turneriella sp.]|nr:phosphate/phosphite/phosphonate ABC transporter substrate-binding protein [Turneriella sp.]
MAARVPHVTLLGLLLLFSQCGGQSSSLNPDLIAGKPEEVYGQPDRQRKILKDEPQYKRSMNFGVTPWGELDKMQRAYEPLTDYLSEKLQVRIRLMIVQEYSELLADLRRGLVDIASFSPGAYADALDVGIDKESLYVASAQLGGKNYYQGIIISKQEIRSLDALRGKTFAFVEEGSSSGYKFPLALLLGRRIDPYSFFSRVYFLGSHPNVVEAVIGGKADAGATWDGYIEENFPKQKPPVHILMRTEPIPYDAVVVGKKHGERFTQKVRRLLVGINKSTVTTEGVKILGSDSGFPYSGYVVNSNSMYDVVRKTSKLVRSYRRPEGATP